MSAVADCSGPSQLPESEANTKAALGRNYLVAGRVRRAVERGPVHVVVLPEVHAHHLQVVVEDESARNEGAVRVLGLADACDVAPALGEERRRLERERLARDGCVLDEGQALNQMWGESKPVGITTLGVSISYTSSIVELMYPLTSSFEEARECSGLG